jgi:uncharacterized protein YjbI with pentapeptide repeats
VSVGTTRVLRADAGALDALADYRAARERGEWRRLLLPGADLRETDMSGLDLDECDLTGAVLDGARFVGASLVRSCLTGASLLGADFSYANLDRADLERADATAAAFVNATLRRADLTGCRLHRADLSDADLSRANLYGSNLTSANLNGALAAEANLRGAVLEDAVLTAMRGEPLFDSSPDSQSPAALFGWPAARLAEPQLVELAGLYLNTQGWGIIEPSSWTDEGIDLIAQREGIMVVVQAKATATPSPQNFTHLAQRLRRTTEGHPNTHLILILPGPVPQSIQDLARANQISVLGVWVEKNTMRVEEVVGINGDPLRASA